MDYDTQCCYENCSKKAEFEIQLQGKPYELTYSCEKHLAKMLEKGKENKVYILD